MLTEQEIVETIKMMAQYLGGEITEESIATMLKELSPEEIVEIEKERPRLQVVLKPIRCRIIDVAGQEVMDGLIGNTPAISKPHVGKLGWAEKYGETVRVKLDDGNTLFGYECWWEPVDAKT